MLANVIAVVAPPIGDYQMPPKSEIKDRQGAVVRGVKLRGRLRWER